MSILLLQGTTFAQQGTLTDDSTYPQGVGSNQVLVVQGPNAIRNQPAASAFIKFKLTGSSSTQMGDLPSGTPGKDIKKATFRLFVSSVTTPASFDVFPITGSWNEDSTTDPPYDITNPVIKGVQVTSANSYLAFDITPLVKQWLDYDLNNPAAGGLANNGIAIVPAKDAAGAFVNPSMVVQFDSKESGKTSHQVQLSVLLDHVAEADHAKNADNANYATTAGTANALASSATVAGGQITGTVATGNGGTGLASSGAAGNVLRSDGSQWTSAALQASDVPGGSGSYIQNTTTQQTGSFNISGNGTVGGNLTAGTVAASTQYNIGNSRVLSIPGTNNFFAGVNAGTFNTSGSHNAFFGDNAGRDNTVGYSNSFFGNAAGLSNTAGVFNSFFGDNAGISNSTGGTNAFFGANAGRTNSTGGGNAFFGHASGRANTTGSLNSFVGDNAGASNTTGSNNTFIGAFSDGAAGITNATAIGANAKATQSNSVVLGNNASVGIGTSAPQAKLHVGGGHPVAGRFDGDVTINGNLAVSGASNISITGNAATVTNGVYTTGSYANPSWITSLDGGKLTGSIGGYSANGAGVSGRSDSSNDAGVRGDGATFGVFGEGGGSGAGVYGLNRSGGVGVFGRSTTARAAVYGENTAGGTAGQFDGNVTINGNLTVTGNTNASNGVLLGTVVAFAGPVVNIPAGWAVCDGTTVTRTGEYANLFAAIGTAWGAGDGSTTFNLPDLIAACDCV